MDRRRYGWLARFFVCAPSELDRILRTLDFRGHRSYGGRVSAWLGLDGYAPLAVLLAIPVLYFIAYGPTVGWRGIPLLALLGAAYLGLYLGTRFVVARYARDRLLLLEWAVVVALGGLVWLVLAGANAIEAGTQPYRHILIPLVFVLISIPAWIAAPLARYLFRDARRALTRDTAFAHLVRNAELFIAPRYPEVDFGKAVRALVSVPLHFPLHLVYPSALAVLLVNDRELMYWVSAGLFALAWLLLAFAGLHGRFHAMLNLGRRALFIGGQLVVSLTIVALAAGRLADFSYISILVESTPLRILALYALAAYSAFWLYEYWINRVLCEQMLALLRQRGDRRRGQVSYPIHARAVRTRVEAADRVLQIHGGARFVAIGRVRGTDIEAFETYEKLDLFQRIVDNQPPLPVHKAYRVREALADIRKRVRFYFMFLNLLLAGIAGGAGWYLHGLPQRPELTARAAPADADRAQLLDLRALLFQAAAPRSDVILVAASGGGTRAALYTASVLHGLHELGKLEHVVLGSGVSGGGAALAYFAAHREQLVAGDRAAWSCYFDTMAAPFIQDVLEGAVEWRIARDTRLGALLDESFQRRFLEPEKVRRLPAACAHRARPEIVTLGQSQRLGLIFNTALAGHPYHAIHAFQRERHADLDHQTHSSSLGAGGRLVLTNLAARTGIFPQAGAPEARDEYLRFVVVRDPEVQLATAAALNANFPPVFSNAAVDLVDAQGRTDRYWVTDGGATDNRGIISLLYALRDALQREAESRDGRGPIAHPNIHIVVAEASATAMDYKQDRGLGSKFGGAEKFASQLMMELLAQVQSLYHARGGAATIELHYLAMPPVLRMRGGLGTHWMLPTRVPLQQDAFAAPDPARAETITVTGAAVKDVIVDLHRAPTKRRSAAAVGEDPRRYCELWRWIDTDAQARSGEFAHQATWRHLAGALGHPPPDASWECERSAREDDSLRGR